MDSPVKIKSYNFAIRIVRMYQYLVAEKREYVLSKQILRAGTSIGANIREGQQGQSRADFIHKMSISLKEASETAYWLDLLKDTGYITEQMHKSMISDCSEVIALLTSIVKSSKNAKQNQNDSED